jgi:DNA-binding NarL/FixJ family response regulator
MPKRILIADDHESVLRRVRAAIESHADWQVCGDAVNGREAINKAAELKPDLVVLDFAMPRMDGLKAAMAIRQLTPNLPIILFTIYGAGIRSEVEKHGIVLVDKAESQPLIATIERLLAAGEKTADQEEEQSDETNPGTSSPLSVPTLEPAPDEQIAAPNIPKAS